MYTILKQKKQITLTEQKSNQNYIVNNNVENSDTNTDTDTDKDTDDTKETELNENIENLTPEQKVEIREKLENSIHENLKDDLTDEQIKEILSNVNNYSMTDLIKLCKDYGINYNQIQEILKQTDEILTKENIQTIINILK